ncbi:DUF4397 domain-containing protein [Cytophaga hutchinsonii]|uniref:DUF4397 domain-containing protein n=1 Tax=Cytophaga hutchinsonii (strain ATCC 33406 / DSM 1761 / CIP 103989 / NBRC 15051 / NCIMB 9469 / D465) TaxID=269798 RepID=A0A6N4SNQ0_CYTH3|nr:DUF4397 domain-containing protein [Cytophaga hutchinsonii]ABG57875.1 hypothetical protein CHU_0588 [Cytophaga hutchinsonii ATCC 33406]SFX07916.1 protein of unknown function [Cytophaga hutchinsonii ATCC 33406]
MFKKYILALAIVCAAFVSCKDDKDEAPAPTTPVVEKKTSVLVINAISDNSSAVAFKLDADAIATVGADSYSAYVPVAEGSRKLKFSVNGSEKELPVTIEKDKYYTLIVYGTSENPAVTVVTDNITTAPPATNFSYRYINVFDSTVTKSVSAQAFYPSFNKWATQVGAHENIAFGQSSAFTNYPAGIDAEWRIIKAGTETTKGELSGAYNSDPREAANGVYTPTDKARGTAGQHFTYVIFGHGTTGSYKLIVHESQVIK